MNKDKSKNVKLDAESSFVRDTIIFKLLNGSCYEGSFAAYRIIKKLFYKGFKLSEETFPLILKEIDSGLCLETPYWVYLSYLNQLHGIPQLLNYQFGLFNEIMMFSEKMIKDLGLTEEDYITIETSNSNGSITNWKLLKQEIYLKYSS